MVDGTSNTVMLSEVIGWHVASGTGSTSPAGVNNDVRGATLCPSPGGNTFTGKFPPNSQGTDVLISVATNIPAGHALTATKNVSNGQVWAAARSSHTSGVNVAFADGSVRFVTNSVNTAAWSAACTLAGGETLTLE